MRPEVTGGKRKCLHSKGRYEEGVSAPEVEKRENVQCLFSSEWIRETESGRCWARTVLFKNAERKSGGHINTWYTLDWEKFTERTFISSRWRFHWLMLCAYWWQVWNCGDRLDPSKVIGDDGAADGTPVVCENQRSCMSLQRNDRSFWPTHASCTELFEF